MLANVKIEQGKENPIIYKVYVDGKQIHRIASVDFNIDYSSSTLPEVNILIGGGIDFEGMADIHFDYSPLTVKEACKILQKELLKHEELYNGFIASIASSLHEEQVFILPFQDENDIAEKILERIIGEE